MRRPSWKTLAVIFLVAVGARLFLVALPFAYIPDIYYYDAQAIQALFSGADPYGHNFTVPSGLQTPGAQNSFAYLPGVLLFLAPFGVAGDVRLGLIACDLLVGFALLYMGGKWATFAAGAFLLFPATVLFSTWYPNDTLVAMAFLGLALMLEVKGKPYASALFVGASLASSQFVWIFYPFFLLIYLKGRRLRQAALGLVTAAAMVAPFLVWSPAAFIHDTVFFEFGRPVQSLVTPEPFGLNVNPTISGISMTFFGAQVGFAVKAAILLMVLALLLYRTKSFPSALLNGSIFLLAATFILPNDFSPWYLELPFQLLLARLALAPTEGDARAANP
ncbi:MAG: hypothetical protein OK438_01600 [Thaumarchaeota archaeon]|nr:hypothetical protein [Nitrososphaerota archaeon]